MTGGAVAGSGTSVRAGIACAGASASPAGGVPDPGPGGAASPQPAAAATTAPIMTVRRSRGCNTAHSVRIPAGGARGMRPALINR